MGKHKYLGYKYKIDCRVMEEIWGNSIDPTNTSFSESAYVRFREKVLLDHFLMFNEHGTMDNPDGCYYFNNVEEIVFQYCSREDRNMMRIKIIEKMVPRDTIL